ncbi:hypothetical protein ACFFKC_06610 [Pseudoduganella danionis]|uniref:HNH nuclease domain-containing protein n=1 Tax=Pseudoduganella danionis TaxID=1890295 RepID=A0ABW9SUV1_9BURK|nr:hypothetical protein [Pseudoduganella danionis]MTW34124.1 hypothetical protein [Pseudoduganella danionis]
MWSSASLHQNVAAAVPTFVGFHPKLCFIPQWHTSSGYGSIQVKEANKPMSAHRLVVALLVGEITSDDYVLHRCGVAACRNPYHLYVAGPTENYLDRLLHNDTRGQFGPHGLSFPSVHMPEPLALSQQPSRIAKPFAGFSPDKCFFADWLPSTFDGYRQFCASEYSGEFVGAHRKIYELFVGPHNRYGIVSHTCDNEHTCLNPYHLCLTGEEDHRDFDAKHDKRCKISAAGFALIADKSRPISTVARELNIHLQTARGHRANARRS